MPQPPPHTRTGRRCADGLLGRHRRGLAGGVRDAVGKGVATAASAAASAAQTAGAAGAQAVSAGLDLQSAGGGAAEEPQPRKGEGGPEETEHPRGKEPQQLEQLREEGVAAAPQGPPRAGRAEQAPGRQQSGGGEADSKTRITCDRPLTLTSTSEIKDYASYLLHLLHDGAGRGGGEGEGETGGGEAGGGGALDAVILDAPSLMPRRGGLARRWYSEEGVAGLAQLHLAGPLLLLHELEPELTSSSTRIVVAASLLHRLATLPSPRAFLASWHEATASRCQLAAAALAFEVQRRLGDRGVTACVADAGERPPLKKESK
jgi:hypothetical protein